MPAESRFKVASLDNSLGAETGTAVLEERSGERSCSRCAENGSVCEYNGRRSRVHVGDRVGYQGGIRRVKRVFLRDRLVGTEINDLFRVVLEVEVPTYILINPRTGRNFIY